MAIDYSKWDETYKIDENELEELEQNNNSGKDFDELPCGKYEVKFTQLELGTCKKDSAPMITAVCKIIDGKYKNWNIFINKKVDSPSKMHFANEFLRSLKSRITIKWKGNYKNYADTIQMIFDEIEDSFEYGIEYQKNNKGFPEYTITDVWEVEN